MSTAVQNQKPPEGENPRAMEKTRPVLQNPQCLSAKQQLQVNRDENGQSLAQETGPSAMAHFWTAFAKLQLSGKLCPKPRAPNTADFVVVRVTTLRAIKGSKDASLDGFPTFTPGTCGCSILAVRSTGQLFGKIKTIYCCWWLWFDTQNSCHHKIPNLNTIQPTAKEPYFSNTSCLSTEKAILGTLLPTWVQPISPPVTGRMWWGGKCCLVYIMENKAVKQYTIAIVLSTFTECPPPWCSHCSYCIGTSGPRQNSSTKTS